MDPDSNAAVERAILCLFRAIDADDAALVAAMFTVDGIWHRRDGDRVGRIAIAQEMRSRPRGRRIVHLISNLVATADKERCADLTFRTLAFADDEPVAGQPSPISLPIALDAYRAHLVSSNGVWLTASLASERLFAKN